MATMKPPICKLAARLEESIRARMGNTATLEEYCEKVGLSKSNLARVLLGRANVTLMTLQKMCDHLGCDIGDLFRLPPKGQRKLSKKKSAE